MTKTNKTKKSASSVAKKSTKVSDFKHIKRKVGGKKLQPVNQVNTSFKAKKVKLLAPRAISGPTRDNSDDDHDVDEEENDEKETHLSSKFGGDLINRIQDLLIQTSHYNDNARRDAYDSLYDIASDVSKEIDKGNELLSDHVGTNKIFSFTVMERIIAALNDLHPDVRSSFLKLVGVMIQQKYLTWFNPFASRYILHACATLSSTFMGLRLDACRFVDIMERAGVHLASYQERLIPIYSDLLRSSIQPPASGEGAPMSVLQKGKMLVNEQKSKNQKKVTLCHVIAPMAERFLGNISSSSRVSSSDDGEFEDTLMKNDNIENKTTRNKRVKYSLIVTSSKELVISSIEVWKHALAALSDEQNQQNADLLKTSAKLVYHSLLILISQYHHLAYDDDFFLYAEIFDILKKDYLVHFPMNNLDRNTNTQVNIIIAECVERFARVNPKLFSASSQGMQYVEKVVAFLKDQLVDANQTNQFSSLLDIALQFIKLRFNSMIGIANNDIVILSNNIINLSCKISQNILPSNNTNIDLNQMKQRLSDFICSSNALNVLLTIIIDNIEQQQQQEQIDIPINQIFNSLNRWIQILPRSLWELGAIAAPNYIDDEKRAANIIFDTLLLLLRRTEYYSSTIPDSQSDVVKLWTSFSKTLSPYFCAFSSNNKTIGPFTRLPNSVQKKIIGLFSLLPVPLPKVLLKSFSACIADSIPKSTFHTIGSRLIELPFICLVRRIQQGEISIHGSSEAADSLEIKETLSFALNLLFENDIILSSNMAEIVDVICNQFQLLRMNGVSNIDFIGDTVISIGKENSEAFSTNSDLCFVWLRAVCEIYNRYDQAALSEKMNNTNSLEYQLRDMMFTNLRCVLEHISRIQEADQESNRARRLMIIVERILTRLRLFYGCDKEMLYSKVIYHSSDTIQGWIKCLLSLSGNLIRVWYKNDESSKTMLDFVGKDHRDELKSNLVLLQSEIESMA